jgi:hypothetical protein
VTWVSGVLAGDRQCQWAPWFRAHFRYDKADAGSFDLAAWTADHTVLVSTRAAELTREGWLVSFENDNAFRLHGQTVTLSGKPDILARRDNEALVVDAKTGKQRHSDWWQVLIYLMALPRTFPDLAHVRLRGEVCYRQHRIAIEPEELNVARREQIYDVLRMVGHADPPERTASPNECGLCDITAADCPAKVMVEESAAATAAEF